MTFETIEEWIDYGIKKGYCRPPVCDTHEGLPLTDEEEKEYLDGGDPCILALRLAWEGPSIV